MYPLYACSNFAYVVAFFAFFFEKNELFCVSDFWNGWEYSDLEYEKGLFL